MWIVTDRSNEKLMFESKPDRVTTGWVNGGAFIRLGDSFPFTKLPSFIQQQQWKDAPIQVKLNISKT